MQIRSCNVQIFSNTFKNFSGLAYTNVHNTPLTDSFYITNAFLVVIVYFMWLVIIVYFMW